MIVTNLGLERATLSLRVKETDIWVANTGEKCLVIFPWYADVDDRRPALEAVKAMGFTDVIETGQLPGYQIPGVDTIDFDYVKVVAPRTWALEADCG